MSWTGLEGTAHLPKPGYRGERKLPATPPATPKSDKIFEDVRSELKRFATEELRSELDAAVASVCEFLKQEMGKFRSSADQPPFMWKNSSAGITTGGTSAIKKMLTFEAEHDRGRASMDHRSYPLGSSIEHLGRTLSSDEESDAGGGLNGWVSRLRSSVKVPAGVSLYNEDEYGDEDEFDSMSEATVLRSSYVTLAKVADSPVFENTDDTKLLFTSPRESQGLLAEVPLASSTVRSSKRGSVRNSVQSIKLRPSQIAEDFYSRLIIPKFAQQIVEKSLFEYIVCLVIAVNALVLGAEADWEVQNLTVEHPIIFQVLDIGFCFFFSAEMVIRMVAYGPLFFSCSTPDWRWNYFDLLITCLQDADVTLSYTGAGMHPGLKIFKIFRMIRLFRCARIFRMVRVLRLVPELHLLVVTCAGSMKSLFWTMTLLLLCTYVFGIYLTQVVAEHGVEHPDDLAGDSDLRKYYGSILTVMLKLYQTMFNGEDWSKLTEPLMEVISPWLGIVFSAYIAVTVMCLLNVITGVFLTSAMQSAEGDKNRRMVDEILRLFMTADVDLSGNIGIEEFEEHLHHPQMQQYLQSIDLLPEEASELFFLLDREKKGYIKLAEFTNGCMRLRGNTKAIDFAVFVTAYEGHVTRQISQLAIIENLLREVLGDLPDRS